MVLISGRLVLDAVANAHRRILRKRVLRDLRKTGRQHGQAHWATPNEIRKAGLYRNESIFLGRLNGKDLYYPGETHLLTIAPPGAGKGTCLAVPNLLMCQRSMIVTDPKGELYAMTGRHRKEKLGHEVIVLAPWAEKMSAELEMEIPDHGFNPLSILSDGPDAKDDAELLSTLLLPGKAQMNASDEFWQDGGQSLLTAFMLYLSSRYETIDLPMLRKRLLAPPELLFETLDDMSHSDAFDGTVAEYGGKLLGTLKNAPQQFEGAMGTAQKALRIYDPYGPMAKHVASGTIDFRDLKEKPVTIYLVMPSDRASTHAGWLNLVISLAIELVGRDRSNRKVLFLLDEFANLGYLPNVLRGMAQYRGQGVQVWSIIQQISQLERLYGREGLQDFMGMAELVNTFGVWEPQTLQLFSNWMGSKTVRSYGQHLTPDQEQGHFGYNFNASDQGAPLMRPEDIRTMPPNEQLIFFRNLAPIRARKVSYRERHSLRRLADPNPYFRKS